MCFNFSKVFYFEVNNTIKFSIQVSVEFNKVKYASTKILYTSNIDFLLPLRG